MAEDDLKKYRGKRDFAKTREPRGRRGSTAGARFVIQHHDASTDHYDFRLEVDGVLKSWSVPKGPSTDPREKRLAVPTEDHPLEYGTFEGVIPEGEYGAGTVLVWDAGTYENTTARHGEPVPMADGLHRGHVTFALHGEKLTGGYALTRFRTGKSESWLLVKARDDGADARRTPVRTQPESVRSGRTLDEVAGDDG
ncbi:MAG: DNA ligase [Streptosporangiales bacterium]|nr:DNA ligase [Streptosporangiales bacterium]MBO0889674.1 DNA ligase [Acidothermales bacterium]